MFQEQPREILSGDFTSMGIPVISHFWSLKRVVIKGSTKIALVIDLTETTNVG